MTRSREYKPTQIQHLNLSLNNKESGHHISWLDWAEADWRPPNQVCFNLAMIARGYHTEGDEGLKVDVGLNLQYGTGAYTLHNV